MAPRPRTTNGTTLFGDDVEKPTKRQKPPTDPVIAECFAMFVDLHVAKHGIKPPIRGGKDGKHFKDLLATYGRDEVFALIRKMFGTSDPRVVASDYTVGAFYSLAPHLALLDRRNGPKDRRAAENFDAASRATQRKTDTRRN